MRAPQINELCEEVMSQSLIERLHEQACACRHVGMYQGEKDCYEAAAELTRLSAEKAEVERRLEQLRHISNVNGDWSMKFSNMQARAEAAEFVVAGVNEALHDRGLVNVHEAFVIYDAALKRAEAANTALLQAREDAQRAIHAFEEYGWHRASCINHLENDPCDCGFAKASAAIAARQAEPQEGEKG